MDVQNDKALDIALGNSRKTKTWKNKTVRWSELLDRLSTVTRTPETMAEYKAMTREQQSRIKDVGGFVGGYCNNGSRSDIRFRSILCLDADFADGDLLHAQAHNGKAAVPSRGAALAQRGLRRVSGHRPARRRHAGHRQV